MDVSLAQSIAGLSLPLAVMVTILLPMLFTRSLRRRNWRRMRQ